MRFDRRELAGAVADLGVLVPIAVALIVTNGLSPTAALLPAGLLYLAVAAVYRLPIPVQPLKAFGAIAIAEGLGMDEIAAGALLMGVVFVVLGSTGLLVLAARAFPRPVIRGVQLVVGLLFLKIAWGLVFDPPVAFTEHALEPGVAAPLAVLALALALLLKKYSVSLVLVVVGAAVAVVSTRGGIDFGPAPLSAPSLDGSVLWTAFLVLVVPQLPLSFANSCLATADAARVYFGERGARVRPGRLATTFGSANLLAGAIGGMPVCHGAGGLTAHVSFGARTAGAPLALGAVLVALAVGAGAGLTAALTAFPLPVLASLLAAAGLLHIGLLRDLHRAPAWATALVVGALGFTVHLALGVAVGLALAWLPRLARRAWGSRPAYAR